MSQSALLVIDVQHSFLHKPFWQEEDLPLFRQRLQQLVEGCQARGVAVVDVFHVSQGPFALESGLVTRLPFLTHQPDLVVHKQVHNALTDSGLHQWLRDRGINHLIISGMRTEQCCETTARVASDLGYRVTYVTEATLTFPMTHANGETSTAADIQHRTELVLAERFAHVCKVEGALRELDEMPAAAPAAEAVWQPQPYLPRPVTPLGVMTFGNWALKRYAIRYPLADGEADFAAAHPLVTQWLPPQAQTPQRPGVGFLIEHQGKTMNYLVAGWWDNENELRMSVWVTDNGVWRRAREESFCVWDMQVMAFERDAFVRMLLQEQPDRAGYLAQQLAITPDH